MVFRTLLIGTLIFGGGAYLALRDTAQARTFFVVMYAIFAQDRELLFESPTIDDAAEEIARRHQRPGASDDGNAPSVRDFTRRETGLPPAPRFER
ncbi:MAG: hypothetical protein AAGA87_13370 [Pseudomonadota bacterium]